jgi:hypothetical protein
MALSSRFFGHLLEEPIEEPVENLWLTRSFADEWEYLKGKGC